MMLHARVTPFLLFPQLTAAGEPCCICAAATRVACWPSSVRGCVSERGAPPAACCRYMQRYAFDFLINVDADEFLWLRSDFMRVRKPLQVCVPPLHILLWLFP